MNAREIEEDIKRRGVTITEDEIYNAIAEAENKARAYASINAIDDVERVDKNERNYELILPIEHKQYYVSSVMMSAASINEDWDCYNQYNAINQSEFAIACAALSRIKSRKHKKIQNDWMW